MKNKTLSLFALSVFALILLVSSVSAAITFTDSNNVSLPTFSASVAQGDSVTVSFKVVDDVDTWTGIAFNAPVTMTLTPGTTFDSSSTVTNVITTLPTAGTPSGVMSLTFDVSLIQAVGAYTGTLTLSGTNVTSGLPETLDLDVTLTVTDNTDLPFCNLGTGAVNTQGIAGLSISNVQITNTGDKELEWNPLDVIAVEVEVKNLETDKDEDSIDDVVLKFGLFDENGTDVSEDLQWISKDETEVELGSLDSKEKIKYTFEFKINTADVPSGAYKIALKTYTTENQLCADTSNDFDASQYYESALIKGQGSKNKQVVVDTNALEQPLQVQCGEKVTMTVDVWNIAESQDWEDKIKVNLLNTVLGLNIDNVIEGGLDAGSYAKVTFTFDVPRNADEKTYPLGFRTYYNYDEDDEVYKRTSDETFNVQLKVAGSCVYATADTTDVTAELVSGGKAGQPLVVTATVKNTGNKEVTYVFNLVGYSAWASLVEITPVNVTLAPGESQDVSITLNVDKDAKGEKSFDFETYSNGQLVTKQPLSATIAGGFSLGSITGGAISESATPLIIGLVSVILVVVIVIVIVKISKKA